MEQFFPSVGKVSHAKKRQTKNVRGHFKTIEHKVLRGNLLKPSHIK
jgi:hypothetical protein